MLGCKTFHTYMIHIFYFYMILTPIPLPVTVPFSILNLINNTILYDTSGKCFEIFLLYWYLIYGLRRELLFDSIINNWPGKLRLFIKIDKCLSVAFKPSTNFYHDIVIQLHGKWKYYMHVPTLTVNTILYHIYIAQHKYIYPPILY